MQTVFGFTLATCIWDWYASDNNFVDLRVVAGRSRTRASSPQAVSRWPCCDVALSRTAWSGMAWARHGKCESDCVNQMGKTHSKPLAARHGRGTAWARHAMCESAFNLSRPVRRACSLQHRDNLKISMAVSEQRFRPNPFSALIEAVDSPEMSEEFSSVIRCYNLHENTAWFLVLQ